MVEEKLYQCESCGRELPHYACAEIMSPEDEAICFGCAWPNRTPEECHICNAEDKRVQKVLGCDHAWWAVFSGAYKLELTSEKKAVAMFRMFNHADEFGRAKWPGLYSVSRHPITWENVK